MCANFLVHQGLCQARRVLLVVSQFAEANDVENHILVEGHAVLERNLHGQHRCFWIVCVDVQHRCFNHLDDVGAVHRRTHIAGVRGRKANLVVDDDMNCAACGVATGLSQSQCFLVDTLTRKSCIAVHQHGQYLFAQRVGTSVHAGAH